MIKSEEDYYESTGYEDVYDSLTDDIPPPLRPRYPVSILSLSSLSLCLSLPLSLSLYLSRRLN